MIEKMFECRLKYFLKKKKKKKKKKTGRKQKFPLRRIAQQQNIKGKQKRKKEKK